MAINLGTGAINKLYLGATEITKAYLGSTEIYSAGGVTNDAFELTVETTAANETFLLPMQSVTSIDIDWGDGNVDTGITTDNPTHVYATAGTHSISVTGTAGAVVFNNSGSEGKLRTVTNLGALGWTTFDEAFANCSSMTSFDAGDCDTSSVTNMIAIFYLCSSLTTLDLSSFDTSSVTRMDVMFYSCPSLTDIIGVEDFIIESVTLFNAPWGGTFMLGFALPTSRYDALLVNWEAQNVNPNLQIGFGNSTYTANSAAATARASLENNDGWTITDGGAVVNNAFELTVETTEANETFLLPMRAVTSIDIDWGDGTVDTGITTDDPTHVYATAGTHAISVTGTAGTVVFDGSGSEGKLRTVTNLGPLGWTRFTNSFRDCSSMTSFDAGDCDTSSVTSMQAMFLNCLSLTTLDVRNFNTSSVSNMSIMFRNCSSLTALDVSSFDTSNVSNIQRTFQGCSSLTDIVGVEDFNIEALNFTNALVDFAANVTLPTSRYDALLINWDAQEPLDGLSPDFGSSQYTAGGAAEAARTSLITGDGWTITDGGAVVNNAFELTVETTAANETFLLPMQSVTSIDIDWGDGNVDTGITSDNPTHVYATAGTHSISVTGTAGTVLFNGSGSEGKLRTVTNLGALGWASFSSSFRSCSSMTSFDPGDCDTSSVTNMFAMFQSCSSLISLDASNFDTSSVTSMRATFRGCSSLTSLDVSSFDTSNVTDMNGMFRGLSSLTTLDVSNFNTSSVTDMYAMFSGGSLLTTLDVSSFNTSFVTRMALMFSSCSSLTDIVGVEDFNIEGLESTDSLNFFASNVTLPTSRYDALLINWDAQDPLDNMTPNFGNSTYTAGGAAETARTSLINGDGWTITDGGSV